MTTPLPPSRRRARGPERQATVNDAMVPGALRGRIPMAAPVGTNEWREARARGVAAVSTPPQVWVRDRFPESGELASVPATLGLTFLPLPNTPVVVELNGIGADEGTDYTVSGKTVTVLAAWDVRVGDVVDVRYPYLSGMPDVPTGLQIVDDFNRADGDLVTTSDGHAWARTDSGSGHPAVVSNKARMPSGSTGTDAVVDPGTPDVAVQATLKDAGFLRNGMIVGRFTNAGNCYAAKTSGTLIKIVGASAATLASYAAFNVDDVMKVTFQGNVITVYKNGAQVAQATDSTYPTQTKFGLMQGNNYSSDWDDFSVVLL